MRTGFRQFFQALQDLCFPRFCLLCGLKLPQVSAILLCSPCLATLRFVRPPLCTCCGRSFQHAAGGNHLCGNCLPPNNWYFSRVRSLLIYNEPAARLIHGFKYGRRTTALATFGALKRGHAGANSLGAADLILPVPLHPKRLRSRGFNQALVLAKVFFPGAGRTIRVDLLLRNRWTEPQTSLSGETRRKNLAGAFTVPEPCRIVGKKILLIDDVYTTGTTVNVCAHALLQAGAAEVQALTLARVEEPSQRHWRDRLGKSGAVALDLLVDS